MLDELIALQQRGIVSVLEGSPAVVRDTYIDIFDVLTADMKSAGLTEGRAVHLIRTNRTSKRPSLVVSTSSRTTHNAQPSCQPIDWRSIWSTHSS